MKSTLLIVKTACSLLIVTLFSFQVTAQGSFNKAARNGTDYLPASYVVAKPLTTATNINLVSQKSGSCTYTENFTPNLAIPDNDPNGIIDSRILTNVPGTTLGVDAKLLQVCLTIDHTWVGDIVVNLTAPNGKTVTLIDRPGIPATSFGCDGTDIDVCFDLGSGNDLEAECNTPAPAISGSFSAHDGADINEINLGGGTPNDEWNLFVSDGQFADTGVLVEWSLVFNDGPVATWDAPKEACSTGSPIDLSTLIIGTTGGTFSGQGVTGNNFNPSGLSGPIDITYDVVDGAGCTDTETHTIEVTDIVPMASYTYLAFGTTVNFTSTSTGTPGTDYSWDFGDTSMGSGESTQHTYAAPGPYTVILTATNACGVDTSSQVVDVLVCTDEIADGSFEAGAMGGVWTEVSLTFGTPICEVAVCGNGTGTGPSKGDFWAWFGGWAGFEEASVSQSVMIPSGTAGMTFKLEQFICDSPDDFMNVAIDGDTVFTTNGGAAICGTLGYATQTINLDAYADGNSHDIIFFSRSYGTNQNVTNFFVDEVTLFACPFVGINENLLDQHITVSPNPASEYIDVVFEGLSSNKVKIEAYDILGKQKLSFPQISVPGNYIQRLDVSTWSSGIYFVKIYDGDYFITRKVVVN